MSDFNGLDMRSIIHEAVEEIFDMMLSMDVAPAEEELPLADGAGKIVGTVGLAGKVMGNVNFHVPKDFAAIMTAAMLGMELDEIEGDDEVNDVIGELTNMISGELKSRLCDAGLSCELSIPSITCGTEFYINAKGWERLERFAFTYQQNSSLVEVYMKTSN